MARTYKVNGKYYLGVTAVRKLNSMEECPAKIKAIMDGADDQTDSMEKGNFFESLVVGCTSDGTVVETLPLLKNKEKSADQKRIEQQAEKCKQLLKEEFKFTETGKQVELVAQINDHFFVRTYLDLMGKADSELIKSEHVVIDLKLTADVNSRFGDYCWGSPEFLDHTQPKLIDFLYDSKFHVKPDFYYFVFDYGTAMGFKFIKKRVTEVDRMEVIRSIEYAMERVAIFEEQGWHEFPSQKNCKSCPINTTCKSYRSISIEEI